MAIFSTLWTRYPTISPMTNGRIITTIGGKPAMLPDVRNPNRSSTNPKSTTPFASDEQQISIKHFVAVALQSHNGYSTCVFFFNRIVESSPSIQDQLSSVCKSIQKTSPFLGTNIVLFFLFEPWFAVFFFLREKNVC